MPAFLSVSSIVNIISLTAAKLPIALGIAGCIVLTGTDISAGRCVGLTACVAASLLQMTDYANKMFPNLKTMPLIVVFLAVVAIGALVGLVNGFLSQNSNCIRLSSHCQHSLSCSARCLCI